MKFFLAVGAVFESPHNVMKLAREEIKFVTLVTSIIPYSGIDRGFTIYAFLPLCHL